MATINPLERSTPPFFKQGPSALSRLVFFSALSLFLMAADTRLKLSQPVRSAVATAMMPLQWLARQPVDAVRSVTGYAQTVQSAQQTEAHARAQLTLQANRSNQVEALTLENQRLRDLLQLRDRLTVQGRAAQVLYESPDLATRKVVIDRGQVNGIELASPVLDEAGVLGQVTRVYPMSSEVTLLSDRDHAVPVLNTRTGGRTVLYGLPQSGLMEMRYTQNHADVQVGDVLTTSGVDGVYAPGLLVAKVVAVDRKADSTFSRILCQPFAKLDAALHVLVLTPVSAQLPPREGDLAPPATAGGKPGSKSSAKGSKAAAAKAAPASAVVPATPGALR